MHLCLICQKEFKTIMALSRHITHSHNMKIRIYYDDYVINGNKGLCKFCKNGPTTFNNLGKGYAVSCIECNSLMAIEKREKLRNDVEKFDKFISKVKRNQKNIWKGRIDSGSDKVIRE
jgi:hypothetical protein